MKYRFNGKESRLAFGVYPDTSLLEAREKRRAAKKMLDAGLGSMLKGVKRWPGGASTHSIVMRSATGTVRLVEATHNFGMKTEI